VGYTVPLWDTLGSLISSEWLGVYSTGSHNGTGLSSGALLIASDGMGGSIFAHALILITAYDAHEVTALLCRS
jgi:hypothetical protein